MRELAIYMLPLAVGLAVTAAIAALLIEALKLVLPVRFWFHREALWRWFEQPHQKSEGFGELFHSIGRFIRRKYRGTRYERALYLLAGVSKRSHVAVLSQSTPKVMSLLQAMVSAVLDRPERDEELYGFLTLTAPVPEPNESPKSSPLPGPPSADAVTWRQHAGSLPKAGDDSSLRARDALERLIERKLDALQLDLEHGWTKLNRQAAFLAGLLFAALVLIPPDRSSTHWNWLAATWLTATTVLLAALETVVASEIARAIGGERRHTE